MSSEYSFLESPQFGAIVEKFYLEHPNNRLRIHFRNLADLLRSNRLPFFTYQSLYKVTGLKETRLSEYYRSYLAGQAPEFPVTRRGLKGDATIRAQKNQPSAKEAMNLVLQAARSHGLQVERVVAKGQVRSPDSQLSTQLVEIEGVTCSVHTTAKELILPGYKAGALARFRVRESRREKAQILIFVQKIPGYKVGCRIIYPDEPNPQIKPDGLVWLFDCRELPNQGELWSHLKKKCQNIHKRKAA